MMYSGRACARFGGRAAKNGASFAVSPTCTDAGPTVTAPLRSSAAFTTTGKGVGVWLTAIVVTGGFVTVWNVSVKLTSIVPGQPVPLLQKSTTAVRLNCSGKGPFS